MIVLGIETSSRWSGVALAGPDGPIGSMHLAEGGRTEHIHLLMVRLVEAAGFGPKGIDGVAVSLGPGSFTGLRIGLGAAKGLALGRGIPIVGLPLAPILAGAAAPWEGRTAVWIDAGRGEVWGALFRAGEEVSPGRTGPPEGHLRAFGEGEVSFVGSGAKRYRLLVEKRLGARARFADGGTSTSVAIGVALAGRRRLSIGGGDRPDDLEPLYLRDAVARRPGA